MNNNIDTALDVRSMPRNHNGTGAAQARQHQAADHEVVQLTHTLTQAFAHGDADTIRRLVADDAYAILGYSGPETKADALNNLAHLNIESATVENLVAIPFNRDLVAVSFTKARRGTFRGQPLTPRVYSLAVWARRDGRWQQLTYQETLPGQQ